MMKNNIRLIGVGLLALLLAFTGCSNPLDERPDESPESGSSGNLVISLGNLDARTLGPATSDIAGLTYRLVLRQYEVTEQDIDDFSGPVEVTIAAGTWTVGVYAYTEDKLFAKGEKESVQVVAGTTKAVSLTLLPVTDRDAAGKFEYTIEFPDPTPDFYYQSATLTLIPLDTNSTVNGFVSINLEDDGKDADTLELPAGKYTMDLNLISGRGINGKNLKVTRKETVYIYPDLTTKAEFEFDEDDFGADVYLNGYATVNNYGSKNYTPTQVQLMPYDWNGEDTLITAAISNNGSWELLVPSEEIGGAYNVSSVQLRFKVESGGQTLLSNWESVSLNNIQGNDYVRLSTTVYSITQEDDSNFDKIEGQPESGIAHNRDAIAGSQVSLKIVPKSNYGIVGNSVRYNGNPVFPEQDGTISFTMPSNNVEVSADFLRLEGTASISSDNPYGHQMRKISAYADSNIQNLIGDTTVNGTQVQWSIPLSGTYVYGEKIYFKVLSQVTTGQPNQEYVITKDVSTLFSNGTVTLDIPLFKVSNFRVGAITESSVTLAWDSAAWATDGYKVYRRYSAWDEWDFVESRTVPSYTDNTSTIYSYAVAGVYTGEEGEKTVLNNILVAPGNLSATVDQNSPLQISLSWTSVPRAQRYYVYRDGNYIDSVYGTSWNDTINSSLLGSTHSYTVKAVNTSYDKESDSSAPVLVSLPSITGYLSVNNTYYESISAPGEVQYYYFYANSGNNYRVRFEEGLDVYGYFRVDGSTYSLDWDNTFYSYSYQEVIVAVRSYYSGTTGSYGVRIEY